MMQVYPLHEENIVRFCGLPVCVIMQDGSRHAGILSSCGNGRLILNGPIGKEHEAHLAKVAPQTKKKKKKGKAEIDPIEQDAVQTQSYDPYYNGGYGGYNPWGGALLFDLALIAFLFLLI